MILSVSAKFVPVENIDVPTENMYLSQQIQPTIMTINPVVASSTKSKETHHQNLIKDTTIHKS